MLPLWGEKIPFESWIDKEKGGSRSTPEVLCLDWALEGKGGLTEDSLKTRWVFISNFYFGQVALDPVTCIESYTRFRVDKVEPYGPFGRQKSKFQFFYEQQAVINTEIYEFRSY